MLHNDSYVLFWFSQSCIMTSLCISLIYEFKFGYYNVFGYRYVCVVSYSRYSIWDVIFFEGRDCQFRRINDDNIPRFMNSVASSMKMDILQGSMLLSTTFSLAGSRAGSDESTPNKLST
jgi:hypothetical protein